MYTCEEHCARLMLYLDDELEDAEKRAIECHLKECSACREAFNRERWFLECVHTTRPLYAAAAELRERVTAIVDAAVSPLSPAPSQPVRHGLPSRVGAFLLVDNRYVTAAIALVLLVVASLWTVTATLRPWQITPSFASMAVDTHQRYLQGKLPLEVVTDVPEEISDWFEGKVPFSLKLPNYQQPAGQEKLYRMEGARLVAFENDYAAYVAYQMQRRPISLVVTSSSVAQPSGAEKITSKGLVFHYDAVAGFEAITWSHRGLTYALVSDLEADGQQSCLVCHQGASDQNFIESLRL